MYTHEQHCADKERIAIVLDRLLALQEEFKDVIAIPEVITLHDITEYRIATPKNGVKQFKQILDKQAAEFVLHYFAGADYIQPENFENTLVCALSAYRRNNKSQS